MRNRKWRHFNIADFKFLARMHVLHVINLFLDALICEHLLDHAMRRLGEKRQALPFALQLAKAVRVIGVFVGNYDAIEVVGFRAAQRFQAAQRFFLAKPGIDKESGVFGLKQRGVARTTRS